MSPGEGVGPERDDGQKFEELLQSLSVTFLTLPPVEVLTQIHEAQRLVCECLNLDFSSLWLAPPGHPETMVLDHCYLPKVLPPGFPGVPPSMSAQNLYPWALAKILRRETIVVARVDEAPPEAAQEQARWRHFGWKSLVTLPLYVGGGPVFGALSFHTAWEEREWDGALMRRLQIVADIFASTLTRMRTEGALREAEARYRGIFEGAIEGVFRTTPEGRVTVANPALAVMLGYDFREVALGEVSDVAQQVWADPDERSRFVKQLEDLGFVRDYECQFRKRDGSLLWVSIDCRVVRQPDGSAGFFEGFVGDIGPRKRAEQELEERLRFETFISEVSARFVTVPPEAVDGEIERALQGLLVFFHCERCGLVAEGAEPGVVRVTHGAYADGVKRVPYEFDLAAHFPWCYDLLFRKAQPLVMEKVSDLPPEAEADRRSFGASGTKSTLDIPILSGQRVFNVILINSVAAEREWPAAYIPRLRLVGEIFAGALEQARIERALRESEERLRLAAHAAEFGAYDYDLVTGAGVYSPEFLALYGLPPGAELAMDADLVPRAIHPEDRPLFLCRIRASSAPGGDGLLDLEFRICRPDGQERWLRVRGRTTFAGEGPARRPVRANGIIQDISDRKSAELETQRSRSELTHLSRVAMLGELSGSLAHELNQPLAAILSNAQAAQRFLVAAPPNLDEVRDILGDIVEDDQRAGEVIRRLRMLLKKGEVSHLPLNLNEVVQDVLKMIRSDLVNHGITLRTQFASVLPVVTGDRVQLQQVLLNLIMNANEAMALAPPPERILLVKTQATGAEGACVSVSDSGTGMPREVADNIFHPFFTTKATGMGMGLKVCRTIITAHGGELHGENNPDRGATFSFTLPAAGGGQGEVR